MDRNGVMCSNVSSSRMQNKSCVRPCDTPFDKKRGMPVALIHSIFVLSTGWGGTNCKCAACGATTNKQCHSHPFPTAPPHFPLLPNGGKWELPTPPLGSPSHKKCIFGGFGPRISHFSIEKGKKTLFPPQFPPFSQKFPNCLSSVPVTFRSRALLGPAFHP